MAGFVVGDLDFAHEPAVNLAKIIPGADLAVLVGGAHSAICRSLTSSWRSA